MVRFLPKLPLFLAALIFLSAGASAAPAKKKSVKRPAVKVPAATPIPLAPGELPLIADAAIAIDAFTGEPLYEKDADTRYFPASTTKVMTALLIIEAGELDRSVEIAVEDSKVGESGLGIKPGERYTRWQMLHGLMLKSANDVAHALGRDNAGSMPAFALKMTIRAKELGALHTSFRNPHGLHHAEHYTTARDLAIIGRAAMQQPFFRKLVTTPRYDWPAPSGLRPLPTRNRMLTEFPGSTGIKTGFTNPAQHTFMGGALRGGREVISVVLHSTRQGKWDDSMLLLSYGLQRLIDDEAGADGGE